MLNLDAKTSRNATAVYGNTVVPTPCVVLFADGCRHSGHKTLLPGVGFGANVFRGGNTRGTAHTGSISGFGTAHTASACSILGVCTADFLCHDLLYILTDPSSSISGFDIAGSAGTCRIAGDTASACWRYFGV